MAEPPSAPRRPHALTAHGHRRLDDWYWIADREDPEVVAYLQAENEYAAAVMAPTEDLQEKLFEEIKSRVQETDAGPPTRDRDWWYYSRTVEGLQYSIACRLPDGQQTKGAAAVAAEVRAGTPESEQVVLDENALAGDSDFLAVGVFDISPDHSTLAYAVDLDGSEKYNLRFKDLETGADRPDVVEGVYYGSAWAADNQTFFYVRPDPAMRPWQVWRHTLGAAEPDELVYQEDDEHFFVGLSLSRSGRRVVIHSQSKTSSECRWIDADRPAERAQVLLPRQPGVEYEAEHNGSDWYILTNRDGATNFALYRFAEGDDPNGLQVVIDHRPDVKLDSVDAFAGHAVVAERWATDGLERLRVLDRDGTYHTIDQPEPVYSLIGEANPEWDSPLYRFGYTSLVTPRSSIEYDVANRTRRTVWTQNVPGGYDPDRYQTERLWAEAPDGTRIPISLVAPKDRHDDGPPPCLLYGYGAYEITIDPTFSVTRLSLLERGAGFAIAHVRGGGELGRAWYEQGRMEHKGNTFTDFIAAATHLIGAGRADRHRMVARGGSAGGLLMGAVANQRPELWRAIVAEVPFVDVVTTMSDTDLPLTVTEWEEWGNPKDDPEAYGRMLSYSPYDNVRPWVAYPAMYVSAGINDPRVGYWEPAKWVARMRAAGAGTDPSRPLLLRTELGAGHQGPSGRYDAWRDEARILAFVLTQMSLA